MRWYVHCMLDYLLHVWLSSGEQRFYRYYFDMFHALPLYHGMEHIKIIPLKSNVTRYSNLLDSIIYCRIGCFQGPILLFPRSQGAIKRVVDVFT